MPPLPPPSRGLPRRVALLNAGAPGARRRDEVTEGVLDPATRTRRACSGACERQRARASGSSPRRRRETSCGRRWSRRRRGTRGYSPSPWPLRGPTISPCSAACGAAGLLERDALHGHRVAVISHARVRRPGVNQLGERGAEHEPGRVGPRERGLGPSPPPPHGLGVAAAAAQDRAGVIEPGASPQCRIADTGNRTRSGRAQSAPGVGAETAAPTRRSRQTARSWRRSGRRASWESLRERERGADLHEHRRGGQREPDGRHEPRDGLRQT